ncbi:MAG: tryptophan synthase subunit alpha [Candidatus Omnitrophica bacterium]|nr:tryptophan synthase subunit alpha [Candidatus Omnitrophota bacterium]
MNRIDKRFRELKRKGKKAFIAYITTGDPNVETTYKLVKEFDRCGVDILELGVPFSDPIADGPTIQAASERALKNRVNIKGIFNLVRRARKASDMPIALMTYYNPVYAYGVKSFVKDAKRAGVDGVIVPDLPPEEAEDLIKASKGADFKVIFLLSPTSSPDRIKLVGRRSSGFIYYVSLTGVTGARKKLSPEILKNVKRIKRVTKKPVCVGFGISNPSQARAIARAADGIIVGSAIIRLIEKNLGKKDIPQKAGRFIKRLVNAVKDI